MLIIYSNIRLKKEYAIIVVIVLRKTAYLYNCKHKQYQPNCKYEQNIANKSVNTNITTDIITYGIRGLINLSDKKSVGWYYW